MLCLKANSKFFVNAQPEDALEKAVIVTWGDALKHLKHSLSM